MTKLTRICLTTGGAEKSFRKIWTYGVKLMDLQSN